MRASYTRHAWARVEGRLALTHDEVAAMLDHGLAVNIGVEGGRAHRLFYSAPDRMCFVAVQDQHDGAVVTVLPIDYHARCAWRVSAEAQDDARALALGQRRAGDPVTPQPQIRLDDGYVSVRASAYVIGTDGHLRSLNLGTWLCHSPDLCLSRLERDPVFVDRVQAKLTEKARPGDRVDAVYLRVGKGGALVRSTREWTVTAETT
jgi:hypothetical protein